MQCTIILIECGPHTQMHGCAKSSNLFLFFFFFKVFFFLGQVESKSKQAVKLVFRFGINVVRKSIRKCFFKELIWCVFLSQNMGPFRPHHISTLPTIFGGKMFSPARVSLTASRKTTASKFFILKSILLQLV